jgi:hypothetical protein
MTTGSRHSGCPVIAEVFKDTCDCSVVIEHLQQPIGEMWVLHCNSAVQAETIHKTIAAIGPLSVVDLVSLGFNEERMSEYPDSKNQIPPEDRDGQPDYEGAD